MRIAISTTAALLIAGGGAAQDWPQWRGPNRDAKVTGFTAPATWPKELTQKWKETVGDGVATPALVGDKLYVFSRQDGKEFLRCLNAADGKEQWQDSYETGAATGPSGSFPGPRCSPTVADGKVVILGVRGTLSCYDTSGKKLWSKSDFKDTLPNFFTSSSPIVVDGLCVAQLGGERGGGIVAYEMSNGDQKWKWTGDGTAYASPVLATFGDTKAIVAETAGMIVAIGLDGKLLWETAFEKQGRSYNACTPMVDGQTVIFSGAPRGTKAVKLEKDGDKLKGKEVWSNKENVQFNTPIVKDGKVYGLSNSDNLFCINLEDGKTAWTAPVPKGPRPAGGGGGGGGGGMRGGGGYGSIVDAGSVLFALTPSAKLVVFQPSDKEFKEVASYKVADGGTYAYPVIAGNRIFIKDKDTVRLLTIE